MRQDKTNMANDTSSLGFASAPPLHRICSPRTIADPLPLMGAIPPRRDDASTTERVSKTSCVIPSAEWPKRPHQ